MQKIFKIGLSLAFFINASIINAKDISSTKEKEYPGIVVNADGEIILEKDVLERLKIMVVCMGAEESNLLKKEALKELITEHIKWHHIAKFTPKGGWVSDKEVEEVFENMASRNNNLSAAQFSELLKKNNINIAHLKDSIKINLAWNRYIEARFARNVNIPENEIKKIQQDIKEKKNQESFYISRMFFPVTDKKSEEEVRGKIKSIEKILASGKDFEELARQFSRSPDSKKGGDLGWVFKGQLSSEEFSALHEMKVGSYKTVRNSSGYYILYLKDKKSAGYDLITTIKFVHVAVPRPEYVEGQDTRALLNELKNKFPSQSLFLENAKKIGCYVSEPVTATLEGMRPDLRKNLSKYKAGQISEIIPDKQAFFVFCILQKNEKKIPEPTSNDIKAQKMNERLSILSSGEARALESRSHIVYVGEGKRIMSYH